MSCSVLAIPYALAWVFASAVSLNSKLEAIESEMEQEASMMEKFNKFTSDSDIEVGSDCEVQVISEKHFIEKSLETPFVDKNLLLKTLKEHGVRALSESDYGQITCYTGSYELKFERNVENKPYYLTIKCLDTDDAENKFAELGNEYSINVQEESYNNIVAKLKENNMQIENEEVCDDNTIVLTVNLE